MSQIQIKVVPPPAISVEMVRGYGVGGSGSGSNLQIGPNTIAGNNTGATAAPTGLTPSQARTLLDVPSNSDLSAFQRIFDLTNVDNNRNRFEVASGVGGTGFAALNFISEYTSEGFQRLEMIANAEDGFSLSHGNMLTLNPFFAGFTSGAGPSVGVTNSGYVVNQPAAFRSVLGLAQGDSPSFAALTTTGNVNVGGSVLQLGNRALIAATNSSVVRVTDSAASVGFSIDCGFDGLANFRNRGNTAAGNIQAGNITAIGSALLPIIQTNQPITHQFNSGVGVSIRNLGSGEGDVWLFGTQGASSRTQAGSLAPFGCSNLTASGILQINNASDYTQISRGSGASGRLTIFRPNDAVTEAVSFGPGNAEIWIRGGLGRISHSGTDFSVTSTSANMGIGATSQISINAPSSVFTGTITNNSTGVAATWNGLAWSAPGDAPISISNTTATNWGITFNVNGSSTTFTQTGRFGIGFASGTGNAGVGGRLHVNGATASLPVIIAQGAASQTANLQEWRNSAGTVLASITASGAVTTNNIASSASDLVINVSAGADAIFQSNGTETFRVKSGTQGIWLSNSASLVNWFNSANINYSAAGVLRIGTTAANAAGSLLLTNLTASGNVTVTSAASLPAVLFDGRWASDPTKRVVQIRVDSAGNGDLSVNRSNDTNGMVWITASGGYVQVASGGGFYFSDTANAATSQAASATISRPSAGVLQIGTTTNNALGSLLLTNLTASGAITVSNDQNIGMGSGKPNIWFKDYATSAQAVTINTGSNSYLFGSTGLLCPASITSTVQNLSTDPVMGTDLTAGQTRIIKNTSTGTVRGWVNDGGTAKSVTYT